MRYAHLRHHGRQWTVEKEKVYELDSSSPGVSATVFMQMTQAVTPTLRWQFYLENREKSFFFVQNCDRVVFVEKCLNFLILLPFCSIFSSFFKKIFSLKGGCSIHKSRHFGSLNLEKNYCWFLHDIFKTIRDTYTKFGTHSQYTNSYSL